MARDGIPRSMGPHRCRRPRFSGSSNRGDYAEAFLLARQALDVVPDDPHLRQLWLDVSVPAVVTTDPAGADVAFARTERPTAWFSLGRTPLNGVRIPRTLIRLRMSKPGFQPIEGSGSPALDRLPARSGGRGAARDGARRRRPRCPSGLARSASSTISGSIDSRSPTGSSRRSSIRAATADATTGASRSSRAARSISWEEAIGEISRRHRTARAGDLDVWNVSRRPGGVPGGRRELVRGGGVRRVRRQEPAHDLPLVPRGGPRTLRGHPDGQQLRRQRPRRRSAVTTAWARSAPSTWPATSRNGAGTKRATDRFLLGGAWNEPRYMFADYDARRAVRAGAGLRLPPGEIHPAVAGGRDRTGRGSRRSAADARTQTPVGDDIFAVYRTAVRLRSPDR